MLPFWLLVFLLLAFYSDNLDGIEVSDFPGHLQWIPGPLNITFTWARPRYIYIRFLYAGRTSRWISTVHKNYTLDDITPDKLCNVKVQYLNGPNKSIRINKCRPGPPQDFEVAAISSTRVKLTWLSSNGSNEDILQYQIVYKCRLEQNERKRITSNGSIAGVIIKDLYPGTSYTFAIRAQNSIGWSIFKKVSDVTLGTLTKFQTDGLTLQVSDVQVNLIFGPLFKATYGDVRGTFISKRGVGRNVMIRLTMSNNPQTIYTLAGLKPAQYYTLSLSSIDQQSNVTEKLKLDLKTFDGIPFEPRNLRVIMVTRSSIEVQWNAPSTWTGEIVRYHVNYTERNKSATLKHARTQSNKTRLNIVGLKVGTQYQISVQAINSAGPGKTSSLMSVKTDDEPSGPMDQFAVISESSTSLTITWRVPLSPNGIMSRYLLMVKRTYVEGYQSRQSSQCVKVVLLWNSISHQQNYASNSSEEPIEMFLKSFCGYKRIPLNQIIQKSSGVYKEIIHNLDKGTKYKVIVIPFNELGSGSDVRTVTWTQDDLSGPVASLTAEAISRDELNILWNRPKQPNGVILGYVLKIIQSNSNECVTGYKYTCSKCRNWKTDNVFMADNVTREFDGCKKTFATTFPFTKISFRTNISDLIPYTKYDVIIIPINGHGLGIPEQRIVRTLGGTFSKWKIGIALFLSSCVITIIVVFVFMRQRRQNPTSLRNVLSETKVTFSSISPAQNEMSYPLTQNLN